MYGYSYPSASVAAPQYSFQHPAVFQQPALSAGQYFPPGQYVSAAPQYSAAPAVGYGYPVATATLGAASMFGYPTYTMGAPFGASLAAEPAKPAIRLTYFDSEGRAEHTRVAFFVAGIQFEDVRITHDEFKESGLKERATFGQLPLLEVGGQVIAQSYAQLIFAGQLSGLYPEDMWERAKVNEALFLGEDLVQAILPFMFEKDEERKEALKAKVISEALPKQLKNIEMLLTENNTGFLAGSKMTIADISLWHYIFNFIQGGQRKDLEGAIDLAAYPRVNDFQARMSNHPRIAEWVARQKARKEAKAAAEAAAAQAPAAEEPAATQETTQETAQEAAQE